MPFERPMWLNSLTFKIILTYVAGVLLSIGLLVLFGTIVKDNLPGMELSDRVQSLADKLIFDDNDQPIGFDGGSDHPAWIYDSLSQETAYRILDADGNIVLASPGAEFWPEFNIPADEKFYRFDFVQNDMLYDGVTEVFERDGQTWLVQLSVSSRITNMLHEEFALRFITLGITVFSLVLLFVFGLGAYISLKYSLRPLREISLEAAAISPQSLGERLQVDRSPTEIAPLIESFNQVLDRLDKGYRTQQEFLAKAAHELKTPLTLIRAEVELIEDEAGIRAPLLSHVEHLARQVQQLLLLAEASEPLSYQFAELYVSEVAYDAVEFLQRIADDLGVRLIVIEQDESVVWRADRGAFFTLLKNLIENALQHSPSNTDISVSIHADHVCVQDQGPGAESEQLPLLFSRFWRGRHRRDHGAGLGLAICQEIAQAHGWTLSARNSDPGLALKIVNPTTAQPDEGRVTD